MLGWEAKSFKVKFRDHSYWKLLLGSLIAIKSLNLLCDQGLRICSMSIHYLVRERALALPTDLIEDLILKMLVTSFEIFYILVLVSYKLVLVLNFISHM